MAVKVALLRIEQKIGLVFERPGCGKGGGVKNVMRMWRREKRRISEGIVSFERRYLGCQQSP